MPIGSWRKLTLGLSTLLGVRARGFFIPYRYAHQVRPPEAYEVAGELFARAADDFKAALAELDRYRDDLARIGATATAPAPRWNQDWFGTLDAAILYATIRTRAAAVAGDRVGPFDALCSAGDRRWCLVDAPCRH